MSAVNNLGGFVSFPPGKIWKCDGNEFSQNKFYFITKGSCTIVLNGREFVGNTGDWFYIPAHTFYKYSNHTDKSFEKFFMHFDLYPNNELFHILNLPYFVKVEKGSNVPAMFRKYTKILNSDNLTDKINIKAILMQLISEYINLAIPDNVSVKNISSSKIDEVLRFINNNIEKPLTITDLSNEFHLHPTHFIRFFKNKTGQTPAKYIKAQKMEVAKRYLLNSDLYINEIMDKIGESDQALFSKQFKSYFSMSPNEYRKIYKNKKKYL